jgi:lysylphosphatidylglycerol synthetase-like protein (DUF2156 family)
MLSPALARIGGLYAGCFAYSLVRYVAFAPKNLENLPVFIVNKGVSMAAALAFALGFLAQLRLARGGSPRVSPGDWFRAGVFGVIWHVPMSLAILEPSYFKEFFRPIEAVAEGMPAIAPRMSFEGELVFMFGGLAAALVFLLMRAQWSVATRRLISLAAMLALLSHVLAMGWSRGLNIDAKHAYLPPMWLLSVIGVAIAVWWLLRTPFREERSEDR